MEQFQSSVVEKAENVEGNEESTWKGWRTKYCLTEKQYNIERNGGRGKYCET
jgi:hypothetical protein